MSGENIKGMALSTAGYSLTILNSPCPKTSHRDRAFDNLLGRPTWRRRVVTLAASLTSTALTGQPPSSPANAGITAPTVSLRARPLGRPPRRATNPLIIMRPRYHTFDEMHAGFTSRTRPVSRTRPLYRAGTGAWDGSSLNPLRSC